MRQNSYTVTVNLSAGEQKLLNQIWREKQNELPTIESAVYKLALSGIRIQLDAKKEENRQRFLARKNHKATQPGAVANAKKTANSSAVAG